MSSVESKTINVIKNSSNKGDATDIALMVSTSSKAEINLWDKSKIVNSLVIETGATTDLAQEIADAVEQKILDSNLKNVTTSIIRELIDIELLERDLPMMHKRHSHLGLPMYDVEQIIFNANKENSNTTHNPESINLTLAEALLKEYALRKVFSEDVSQAHMIGDIHLHDLGFIVRPYCGGHSLEYIKKYGLALPNITSVSKPAKHPEVLIGHMVKMASTLQSHYAGAVGWEAVNIFFAPYIVNFPYDKVKQLAQMLIFEFNQLAGSRGAQVTFTDFNLYYGIPRHFENTPALGPGGKYMKRKEGRIVYYDEPVQGCLTYKDFEKEANLFLKGLFDVYLEGDVTGKTFVFPKPLLHINNKFFETPGHDEFLDFACKVASKQGITYFVFDRGDSTTISQCLHPETKILAKVGNQVFYGSIEELADKRPGWRDVDNISVFASFGEAKKVKGVYARLETRKLLNIKLRDGSIIRATEDHPMVIRHSEMSEDHLAEARDLEIGDLIPVAKRINLGQGKTEIDLAKEAVTTGVDLRVSGTKNRIANCAALARKYKLHLGSIEHFKRWDRFPSRIVVGEKFQYQNAKVAFVSEHNCQVPTIIELDYDLGRFIGLYAAEGNVNKTQVRFCFNSKEKEYLDFTKRFIDSRLGKHTWVDRSNKWDSVVVSCSSRTVRWLLQLFVAGEQAKNKRLTQRVFDANEEFRKGLVEGFLEGDGYHRKGATTIETSFHIASGDLAEDMRTLMKTLGINTTIVHRRQPNPRNREQILDSHSVRVAVDDLNKLNFGEHNYTKKNNKSIWKWNYADDCYGYLPIVSIAQEDYFGLVYDFEMAEEPLFHLANGVLTHNCCRLKLRLGEKDLEETKTPEKMRFSALQNVTINLPRIAYKARGNDELLFTELNRTLDLVARAHVSKKKFISDLIDLRERGPLYMFSATQDGSPYLRMDRLTYLCGLLGLNELVQAHLSEQLHESDRALKFGLKIVSYMNLKCRQLSERYGIKMVLEESPAESAAYRLAKLDMKYFPEQTSRAIKGSLEGENYYYTNSIHLAYDAPVDYIERVEKQSLYHPLVEAGSIIHIWLGEHEPDPGAIKNFVLKTFQNTQAEQIAFSPEFTVCEACRRTTRGLHETCSLCGSDKVYGITRIVGYYSKVPTWNKGKASELKDRIRTDLSSMTKM